MHKVTSLDIGTVETAQCELDTTTLVNAYSKVRMYSTVNDEWDGPLDSSLCYSLVQIGNNWRFPSSTIPAGRSAFFDLLLDSVLPLDTSTVYLARPLLYAGCGPAGCETVHFAMEMPDSSGTDTVNVVIDLDFEYEFEQVACFPTQKIPDQRIRSLIYEFASISSAADLYFDSYLTLRPHWAGTYLIPQTTQPQISGWGPNLVRYWHDIYPTGDINTDGIVNIDDARILIEYLSSK